MPSIYKFLSPFGVNNTPFNPLSVSGLQLYLAKNNATASSWLDQSPNAFDFVQGTAIQQPTVSANSVDFDGVNDIMVKSVANAYSGDSGGIIFFSGYNTGNTQRYLSSSDTATANNWLGFSVFNNKIGIFTDIGGTSNFCQCDTVIPLGYFYGYIESDGSSYEMSVNGAINTFSGTDNGNWFADVAGRDALEIGGVLRNSPLYGDGQLNKILYSNASLTTSEKAAINSFMRVPTNY
jgi:hypothetical protein